MTALYRIPQPWDWHEIAAVFVVAESAEDAVTKVREAAEREETKKLEFFRLQEQTPGLPGTEAGIQAWRDYREAHPAIEYDWDLARGGFDYDGVTEVTSGIGIAHGCDD